MKIWDDASGHTEAVKSMMKRGNDMTKLGKLSALGQAIWFDYIRRSLITSGEMQALIDQGVRGVTSNPTIFEKAIAGSSDYDDDLKSLVKKGTSIENIYENLALRDIADTADLFRKVYDDTKGLDGYVSIEVSPDLAYDTEKTLTEARRLFSLLKRPNIMIKVPATAEGVPAIEALISEGINVNVTLLFGVDRYKETALAYISGLEKLGSSGKDISRVASVASFFVSRVDTVLDPELEKKGLSNLTGRIAIANAKIAYGLYKEIFTNERWKRLEQQGAQPQRLLWASTGTKNPKYPDTLYVDELIGPQTVNTVPPATLQAFLDHGKIDDKLAKGLSEADSQVKRLKEAGIDLHAVTSRLQEDGVKLFADSFRSLMSSITAKRRELITGKNFMDAELGTLESAITSSLKRIRDNNILARIWDHDHTVWKERPKEISNRLGWLTIPAVMTENTREIERFAADVRDAGYRRAYLLGMGGSSLAPEVIRNIFGVKQGYPDLTIVDTTDPGALAAISEGLVPSESLFIVSTKSGSTVETTSAFKYFYTHMAKALGREKAGENFIAITDPGSSLIGLAERHNFRKVFLNEP
ncbi:bifunctional transaldolase/phosoglucose isomerase, partial [archaeon]|nr:bifunctional transaldolase/phosoglucose isomerase [archaeon]